MRATDGRAPTHARPKLKRNSPATGGMKDVARAPRCYARVNSDGADAATKGNRVRQAAMSTAATAARHGSKTLIDAFKQHGTKLCDGSRLNAVGKGIHAIGSVPPSVAANITALYLSQNSLRSLTGVEQFQAIRLLSIGGNLLSRVEELEQLAGLRYLRNLNLVGNPLCDLPNYRYRAIEQLKNVQVLDTADITKNEREFAPVIAPHDHVQRDTLVKNHFEIQKLQRAALLIQLHKEFFGYVFGGVTQGRFDKVPSPQDAAFKIRTFLRLWDLENDCCAEDRMALEQQLLAIVVRTHRKLAEHPKHKAKAYLVSLAGANASYSPLQKKGLPKDIQRQCALWDEAYESVILLQQQTITNVQGLCERGSRDAVTFMKELLIADPVTRARLTQSSSGCGTRDHPRGLSPDQHGRGGSNGIVLETLRTSRTSLPPQQVDPDSRLHESDNLEHDEPRLAVSHLVRSVDPSKLSPQQQQPARQTAQLDQPQEISDHLGNIAAVQEADDAVDHTALHPSGNRSSCSSVADPIRNLSPEIFMTQQQRECKSPIALASAPHKSRASMAGWKLNPRDTTTTTTTTTVYPMQTSRGAERFAPNCRSEFSLESEDELDATSIDATSNATSYVQPLPTSDGTSARTALHMTSRQEPRLHSKPACAADTDSELRHQEEEEAKMKMTPRQSNHPIVSNARLQELEQREEKFIKALMESEQRELNLRNNLCILHRKVTQYQRSFVQDLEERQQIKEEVNKRVIAFSGPKILRRFFIRWVRFYSWTLQVKHVRRKRQFIVQHDTFWRWRRAIWLKQQVSELQRKRQRRDMWIIFGEWTNAARLSVIAGAMRDRRELRLSQQMFDSWKRAVAIFKFSQRTQEKNALAQGDQVLRRCWKSWQMAVTHRIKLNELLFHRFRVSTRSLLQEMLWKWRLFVITVARPIHHRAVALQQRRDNRVCSKHFRALWRLYKARQKQKASLVRRVWRRWTDYFLANKSARDAKVAERRIALKRHFVGWRETVGELLATRRSLSLAKRYLNQRRMRKLWLHWKYFSIARRKYRQNSTKSLKHYFIKLIRRAWKTWKTETAHNLQSVKRSKMRVLRQHFESFCIGVQRSKAESFRLKIARHMVRRRLRRLLTASMSGWRSLTVKRKWSKHCSQMLLRQNEQLALGLAWRLWRHARLKSHVNQERNLRHAFDKLSDERTAVEGELMIADDKLKTLEDKHATLVQQLKDQAKQMVALQENTEGSEKQAAHRASEQAGRIADLEHHCKDREKQLVLEKSRQEDIISKLSAAANENADLKAQVIELKRSLESERRNAADERRQNESLRDEMKQVTNALQSELREEVATTKDLENQLDALRQQLELEHKEREDTANRLQEYELRIATTCDAINHHEEAHERDKIQLRSAYGQLEAQLREEEARTSTLQRLLSEKNEHIQQLETKAQAECELNERRTLNRVNSPIDKDNDRREATQVPSTESFLQRPNGKDLHSQQHDDDTPPQVESLLQEINTSIASRSGMSERKPSVVRDTGACSVSSQTERSCTREAARRQPTNYLRLKAHRTDNSKLETAEELLAMEQEQMIQEHTSKVHDDIRLLQERIAKRLEQAALTTPRRPAARIPCSVIENKVLLSSSYGSLSDDQESAASSSDSPIPTTRKKIRNNSLPRRTRVQTALRTAQTERENVSNLANRRAASTKPRATERRTASSKLRPKSTVAQSRTRNLVGTKNS